MTSERPSQDVPMDEIMASIRRIMTEDEPAAERPPVPTPDATRAVGAMQSFTRVLTPSPSERPPGLNRAKPLGSPASSVPPPGSSSTSILSFLKEKMGSTAPLPSARPRPAATAAAAMASSKAAVKNPIAPSVRPASLTLESVVVEALRPLLKAWLAQNLAPMVEEIIQREVQKMLKERTPKG